MQTDEHIFGLIEVTATVMLYIGDTVSDMITKCCVYWGLYVQAVDPDRSGVQVADSNDAVLVSGLDIRSASAISKSD